MRNEFTAFAIISILGTIAISYFLWSPFWWAFAILGPILLLGFYDMTQKSHAIMRNFPILGRGRYLMEMLRPGIQQYFIEKDIEGSPISRIDRNVVYRRAKKVSSTTPFGTQLDVYAEGYEWVNHSIAALDEHKLDADPRSIFGNSDCENPYSCSMYNVSAMSYGSLSKTAILALNGGANIGNFAHNTGEGGISPFHIKPGGDLIYQIGTGYFGSRAPDGTFSWEEFAERAKEPTVKMIELKLSQGAKPGHGGILPAKKNTPEIAKIRGVEPGVAVLSPPFHKEFNTPRGLVEMIAKMKKISGKPCGFKLCVGRKGEFLSICKAMIELDVFPDFIAVDGGEGGTGAAPAEFSDSVGMPFREGLAFVYDALVGFGIKQHIKLLGSGKIMTSFHVFRAIALGADATYSARAMMLAIGCIQALECNTNHCPTGVATQDPEYYAGLVPEDKQTRVANFHGETIKNFVELMAAAGIDDVSKINRTHIYRRINMNEVKRYDQIYPYISNGCLLSEETIPTGWEQDMLEASADTFTLNLQG